MQSRRIQKVKEGDMECKRKRESRECSSESEKVKHTRSSTKTNRLTYRKQKQRDKKKRPRWFDYKIIMLLHFLLHRVLTLCVCASATVVNFNGNLNGLSYTVEHIKLTKRLKKKLLYNRLKSLQISWWIHTHTHIKLYRGKSRKLDDDFIFG